jgi:hypothetical protein
VASSSGSSMFFGVSLGCSVTVRRG